MTTNDVPQAIPISLSILSFCQNNFQTNCFFLVGPIGSLFECYLFLFLSLSRAVPKHQRQNAVHTYLYFLRAKTSHFLQCLCMFCSPVPTRKSLWKSSSIRTGQVVFLEDIWRFICVHEFIVSFIMLAALKIGLNLLIEPDLTKYHQHTQGLIARLLLWSVLFENSSISTFQKTRLQTDPYRQLLISLFAIRPSGLTCHAHPAVFAIVLEVFIKHCRTPLIPKPTKQGRPSQVVKRYGGLQVSTKTVIVFSIVVLYKVKGANVALSRPWPSEAVLVFMHFLYQSMVF